MANQTRKDLEAKLPGLRRTYKLSSMVALLTIASAVFISTQQDDGELCDLHSKVPAMVQTHMEKNPDADERKVRNNFNEAATEFEGTMITLGMLFSAWGMLNTGVSYLRLRKTEKDLGNPPPAP